MRLFIQKIRKLFWRLLRNIGKKPLRYMLLIFAIIMALVIISRLLALNWQVNQKLSELPTVQTHSITFSTSKLILHLHHPQVIPYQPSEPVYLSVQADCAEPDCQGKLHFQLIGDEILRLALDPEEAASGGRDSVSLTLVTGAAPQEVYLVPLEDEQNRIFSWVFPQAQPQAAPVKMQVEGRRQAKLLQFKSQVVALLVEDLGLSQVGSFIAIILTIVGWQLQTIYRKTLENRKLRQRKINELQAQRLGDRTGFLREFVDVYNRRREWRKTLNENFQFLRSEEILGILSDAYRQDIQHALKLHEGIVNICSLPLTQLPSCFQDETIKSSLIDLDPNADKKKNRPIAKTLAAIRSLVKHEHYKWVIQDLVVHHVLEVFELAKNDVVTWGAGLPVRERAFLLDPRLARLNEAINEQRTPVSYLPAVPFDILFPFPSELPAAESARQQKLWLWQTAISENPEQIPSPEEIDKLTYPFGDHRHPLLENARWIGQYWQEPAQCAEEFKKFVEGHSLFACQNSWDAQAGLYGYVRNQAGDVLETSQTLITVLKALRPNGYDQDHIWMEILKAISDEWLNRLVYAPYLLVTLTPAEQSCLARLLIHTCGSPASLAHRLNEKIEHFVEGQSKGNPDAHNSEFDWARLRDQITVLGEKAAIHPIHEPAERDLWLNLRPRGMRKTVLVFALPDPWLFPERLNQKQAVNLLKGLAQLSPQLSLYRIYLKGFVLNSHLLAAGREIGQMVAVYPLAWDEYNLQKALDSRVQWMFQRPSVGTPTTPSLDSLLPSMPSEDPAAVDTSLALARKANGSMGRLVCLGHQLLTGYCAIPESQRWPWVDTELLESLDLTPCPE